MIAASARPVPTGQSARITERQDEPQHLHRLLAYSYYYRAGQWWRRLRAAGTFVLATVGPILAVYMPASTETVAAFGAGWLVIGRTLLTWLEQRNTLQAVRIQELYDTELLHLPWNEALAGRRPSPEDVNSAARHIRSDTRYRNWYSLNLADTPWPADALLCQRQSAVWSRRDHRAYSDTVLVVGVAWFLAGVVAAVAWDLSTADYLIKIFLPSGPAFLDTVELTMAHRRHADARQRAEHAIDDLWQKYLSDPGGLAPADGRAVQDSAYRLRRDGPRVPAAFYRMRRRGSEASTVAGSDSLRAQPARHATDDSDD